jgi:hypothetical protein
VITFDVRAAFLPERLCEHALVAGADLDADAGLAGEGGRKGPGGLLALPVVDGDRLLVAGGRAEHGAGAYAWNISHRDFLMHPPPPIHYTGSH